MAENEQKPICPDCTEINVEECDDELCDIVVPAKCVSVDRDLTCLNIEAGANLDDVLAGLCALAGFNLAVEQTPFESSEDCPDGGVTISIGEDTSGNGSIDNVLVTFEICNGGDGEDGTSQTVTATPIVPGVDCTNGGVQLTVDGVDYFICNGSDGLDGTNCDCEPEEAEIDYSCLESLGVTIGDNPQQTIVNVLCDLIAQVGGVNLTVTNKIYNIEVGETLQINLLDGSTIPPGDSVTAVTITGLQTGAVDYNGEGTNVSTDGILDITGLIAGSDNRNYEVETDAPATSNSATATLRINVTEPPAPVLFFGGTTDQLCFKRNGQNQSFEWDLPINPTAQTITGTIRFSTTGGGCLAPSGCADTDSVDVIIAVFGGAPGSVLFSSGNQNITLDVGSDGFAGGFSVDFPYATVSCGGCSPPKVWGGDPVIVTIDLSITTPSGNASYNGSFVIPQMTYPDDYPHTEQESCFGNPELV